MHNISIATAEDIHDLTPLLALLFKQEADFKPNTAIQARGLKMIIDTPELGCILKLQVNNETVGMINILYSISTALGGKVGIIEDFIITPAFRNKGYGQILFNKAVDKAQKQGCLRVSLLTDNDNESGQRFYSKQGLTPSTMVPFRKTLDQTL